MPESIIEFYPSTRTDGNASVVRRVSTQPRDLGSVILVWIYCMLGIAQIALAIATFVVAGVHLKPQQMCEMLDSPAPEPSACYLTYVVSGLTFPFSFGVMATELLPSHMVSQGFRNSVPLILQLIGCIIWGIQAAALHRNEEAALQLPGAAWLYTVVDLSWSAMGLFLSAAIIKLLSSAIADCINCSSIRLGRICPDGCMPACDACCCLDVRKASVPREVARQGRVAVRYLNWDREMVVVVSPQAAAGLGGGLLGMTRTG